MKKVFIMHPSFESFGGAERALLNLMDMVLTPNEYTVDLLLNTHDGLDAISFPSNVRVLEPLPKLCLPGIEKAREETVALNNRQGVDQVRNWEVLKPVMPSFTEYDLAVGFLGIETVRFVADKVDAAKKIAWLHGMYKYYIMRAYNDYTPRQAGYFYAKMDAIVNVSQTAAKQFKEIFPQLAGRTYAIRNLNDFERVRRLSKAFYPPEYEKLKPRKIVFCAARIDPYKGIDILVEAARLVKQKGMDVAWVIAGFKHPGWEDIQQRIEKYDLGGDVFLLGHVANPYPYFLHSDIVVLPSRSEGEGLSIVEGKVLGKAVVATCFETVTDTLEHLVSGHICDMNSASFAQGVIDVLTDNRLRSIYERYNRKNPVKNEIEKYVELFTVKKEKEELKVSVVVACEREDRFPEELMASLYKQTTEDIEIVLAAAHWNGDWQQRFAVWQKKWQSERGALTLQTEENLPAALVKALQNASGNCICLVRPQDALEAGHCAELADYLNGHPYTDIVVCASRPGTPPMPSSSFHFMENYLLYHIDSCTCRYMVRKKYLEDSNLLDILLSCKGEAAYASAYLIALAMGNGRLDYMDKRLCRCGGNAEASAAVRKRIVEMLDIDSVKKSEWVSMITLGEMRVEIEDRLRANIRQTPTKNDAFFWDVFFKKLSRCWEIVDLYYKEMPNRYLDINKELSGSPRVIGYGALGRAAKRILPLLENTPLYPTELWDKAGEEGAEVSPPAFETLTKDDAAVIFVKDASVSGEIAAQFKRHGVTKIYMYTDIQEYQVTYQHYYAAQDQRERVF